MLNKEVCKNCCNINRNTKWDKDDEKWWILGTVTCYNHKYSDYNIVSNTMKKERACKECPYKLEHILKNGKNN
jgi:hypothetical protein